MPVITFDLENAALYVGPYAITSFADGEAVSIEYDDEDWATTKGTKGYLARAKKVNITATLKVSLVPGNVANQWLAQLRENDIKDGSGAVRIEFREYNNGGGVVGEVGFIKKLPSQAWTTNEPAAIEWELTVVNPTITPSVLHQS